MKTSDVYLAAALLSLGYTLDRVNRADPRHMEFYFLDKKRMPLQEGRLIDDAGNKVLSENFIEDVELMWVHKSLRVNAFDYSEAIKRMKSIIHSQA